MKAFANLKAPTTEGKWHGYVLELDRQKLYLLAGGCSSQHMLSLRSRASSRGT